MRSTILLLVLLCLGCPSKEPAAVTNDVPSSTATTTVAPMTTVAPTASSAATAVPSSPMIERGKPSSLGGGIPGECVNCPPTGCPKSCEDFFKKKN